MKLSLYGKYAGMLKNEVNYIENCSEIELFNQVSCYYEPLKLLNYYHKMQSFYQRCGEKELAMHFQEKIQKILKMRNIKTEKDFDEFEYALEFCIQQTARFHTNIIYNPNGHILLTKEFNDWYYKWQNYVSMMDENTLAVYRRCRYEGKGLEFFQLDQSNTIEKITDKLETLQPKPYQLVKKSIKQVSA